MAKRSRALVAGVVRGVRVVVAHLNKGSKKKLRVSVSKSKCDPKYQWKYDNRFKPRLRAEDAQVTNVYVSVPKGRGGRHKPGPRA
jgi:hypothetical protein